MKLEGYHYHNNAGDNSGAQYVRNTLIDNLLNAKVELPNDKGVPEAVSMQELGITYPVLMNPKKLEDEEIDNPMRKRRERGNKSGRGRQN